MSDAERAALTTAVASFVERHGVSRLIVAGLSTDVEEMREFVGESTGMDVVFATEQASLVGESASTNVAYLVVAQWGRSTDFQLSSAVAALTSVSDGPVGVVMLDVPRRDLDWAGVTAGTEAAGDM